MILKLNPTTGEFDIVAESTGGSGGSVGSSQLLPLTGDIPIGQTAVVDMVSYSSFFAARYFVALKSTSGKCRMFDYTLANDGSGSFKETVFGQLFGGVTIEIESIIESGDIKFRLTNTFTEDLTYKVHKLTF